MEQFGYTESLILEKEPETIVTLSTYPVLTLFAMNVELAAAPSTKVITYPEDFSGILLPSTMSDNFDLEVVVAQNPDLVIMPVTSASLYISAGTELLISSNVTTSLLTQVPINSLNAP